MIAEVNQVIGPHVPHYASTMAYRLRDITRMNPPTFYGSRADEYPNDFLDEVYKILFSMGVTMGEKS